MDQAIELMQAPAISASKRWRIRLRTFVEVVLPPSIFFWIVITFWQEYVTVKEIPTIIMPKPSEILARLLEDPHYFFIENGMITFMEAISGFAIGSIAAMVLAVFLARSRALDR